MASSSMPIAIPGILTNPTAMTEPAATSPRIV
jgi:hypothetical protein